MAIDPAKLGRAARDLNYRVLYEHQQRQAANDAEVEKSLKRSAQNRFTRNTGGKGARSSPGGFVALLVIPVLLYGAYLALTAIPAIEAGTPFKVIGLFLLTCVVITHWRKIAFGVGILGLLVILGALLK